MKKVVLLVTILLLAGFVLAYAGGESKETLGKLKEGKTLMEDNCIDCHELDWPLNKVTDRAGWEETLTIMANNGATLGKEDRDLIINYLVAKSTFQKKCVECHKAETVFGKDKNFEDWHKQVQICVDRKPGVLSEGEITTVTCYLSLGE